MGMAPVSVVFFSETSCCEMPRRLSHFVYGVIQSALTCGTAAGIASFPFIATGTSCPIGSWFVAGIMMLPIVLFAAPTIRNLTHISTRGD